MIFVRPKNFKKITEFNLYMLYIEYLSPEALSQNESEAIEAIRTRPKDKGLLAFCFYCFENEIASRASLLLLP